MTTTIEHCDSLGMWDLTLNYDLKTVEVGFNLYDYSNQVDGVEVTRVYSLPISKNITNVNVNFDYVTIFFGDEAYQFKFEDGGNLIADIFDVNKEHGELDFKDTFACYSFLE